jgi:DNA-binding NarL/FixJ family response regulator
VYETGTSAGALNTVRDLRVPLVVLDIDLDRRHSGLQLCRRLKQLGYPPSVLVFSGADSPEAVTESMASGADGFVHRSATAEQLIDAVCRVAGGLPVWLPREPRRETRTAETRAVPPFARMTQREQEIFALLLSRYSNAEIADELRLARQTVKNHVSSVLQKVGAANRHDVARMRHVAGAAPCGGAAKGGRR